MPPTSAEGYRCPWCNGPYVAMPQPGVMRPPHPQCPAQPTYLPSYSYSYSTWDYNTEQICAHCKQGQHHECTDGQCACPMSTEDGPCLFSQDKARRLADGTQPDHIHY